MNSLTFLKQFVVAPGQTGAVWPSSRHLADVMTRAAGVAEANVVLEFGPGTGSFTKAICRLLPSDARFIGFEINPRFAPLLRQQFPRMELVESSAVEARDYLDRCGIQYCDCIVSGLPFASFGDQLQDQLLHAARAVLRPGGRLVTFTYVHSPYLPAGRQFKNKIGQFFETIERTAIVWRNVPPAFAYCMY